MITPLNQEKLIACAQRQLLSPDEGSDFEGLMRCGWIGAGVGVAAWWIDSDREYAAQEAASTVFAEMREVIVSTYGLGGIPDEAGRYFLAGFNWLLRSWVPVPETIAH